MIMLARTCFILSTLLVPGLLVEQQCTEDDMNSRAIHFYDCQNWRILLCVATLCNPRIPLDLKLHVGVRDGLRFAIKGRPKKNARRFTFNLKQNGSEREMPSIALHFDARFDLYSDKRVIVIDSNIWGQRLGRNWVKIRRFPFTRGSSFTMKSQLHTMAL
ncbi:hypothetical protein EGW08_023722 [Elysia chlorotica]|uniref:Galectin n=1 Tax=Elysia chlorotica TaxID=188477 RepID=A0A433SI60_ELYCH|nr:hypothetical protein EGW08_023722 [Elysia chlorotica]